jgi:hypothetical protein
VAGAGTKGVTGRGSLRAMFTGSSVKTPKDGDDREAVMLLLLGQQVGTSHDNQMDFMRMMKISCHFSLNFSVPSAGLIFPPNLIFSVCPTEHY